MAEQQETTDPDQLVWICLCKWLFRSGTTVSFPQDREGRVRHPEKHIMPLKKGSDIHFVGLISMKVTSPMSLEVAAAELDSPSAFAAGAFSLSENATGGCVGVGDRSRFSVFCPNIDGRKSCKLPGMLVIRNLR